MIYLFLTITITIFFLIYTGQVTMANFDELVDRHYQKYGVPEGFAKIHNGGIETQKKKLRRIFIINQNLEKYGYPVRLDPKHEYDNSQLKALIREFRKVNQKSKRGK